LYKSIIIDHFAVEGHKNTVRSALRLKGNSSRIEREYHIGKGFRGYNLIADVE